MPTKRLEKGPLVVGAQPQLFVGPAQRLVGGDRPLVLEPRPAGPQLIWVGRPQPRPAGVAPVEFGLDQWLDLDAVDDESGDVAVDHGTAELNAAQASLLEGGLAEHRAREVDVVEPRAFERQRVELGTAQIIGSTEPGRHTHLLSGARVGGRGSSRALCPHSARTQPDRSEHLMTSP